MIINYGISFGASIPALLWINGIVIVILVIWYIKSRNWGLILVIGGGILNWWERYKNGYVVDYWKIPGTNIYNNINDWLIFLGLLLVLWHFVRVKKLK